MLELNVHFSKSVKGKNREEGEVALISICSLQLISAQIITPKKELWNGIQSKFENETK